jgi:two-component system, LuxR family, sensor kinase FixL
MNLVTIIWSMVASACFTLAGIYLLVWFNNRTARAYLLFSLSAVAVTAFAFCELWVMLAQTPEEFGTAMRWAHVPLLLWLVSTVWFVRFHLGAGRLWLAWTVCGLRTFTLLPNFLTGQNLNLREITTLRQISFLGQSVSVAEGVPNPWMLVGQLSVVVLVIYVADASVTAWRRGHRQQALIVGGSIIFFLLAGLTQSVLVFWGKLQAPITFSLFYMGLVAAMGYELSRDVLRASQLVSDLQASESGLRESENQMTLAAEATNLGFWIRDLARDEIWATDGWRALFGFTTSERLDFEGFLQRLHSEDSPAVRDALVRATRSDGAYEMEYRVLLPDGQMRWVASRGRVEFDDEGKPIVVRSVSIDITRRKDAEQEALRPRQEIAHVGRVSMMGQLASALAHEITQPLSAILRNTEAAELFMQNTSPDLDEIRAILADIREDDQRAGRVIDRMGRLLKAHILETRPLGVGELVCDVAALVRIDALARHVELKVEVPGDLPPVLGDRVHLQQVLLNLILNAMDAVNGASGQVRRVNITAQLEGAQSVEIVVSDTGHGIPADKLAHIFDPFFTTKAKGMGMGLPISRTIIEEHGGQIRAENMNDGGASFRFTLPIAEKAAE